MGTPLFQFNDGLSYENYMGKWSRLAGEAFLDWLAPKKGLRWLDVGCGNGAFTEMIVDRCSPSSVQGIDPSQDQLAYARNRIASSLASFKQGNAMELPFPDNTFDVAVMPLVIFFVPEPARGVAEMARVVAPGGTVAAYGWDLYGGGFPYEALHLEMRNMGVAVPLPPSPEAAGIDVLQSLWTGAGLHAIETHEIAVQRTFSNFDEYWNTILHGPSVKASLATMPSEDLERLRTRLKEVLPADASGAITIHGGANAIKGQVKA